MLDYEAIEPETNEDTRFLSTIRGELPPETVEDTAYLKFRRMSENQRLSVFGDKHAHLMKYKSILIELSHFLYLNGRIYIKGHSYCEILDQYYEEMISEEATFINQSLGDIDVVTGALSQEDLDYQEIQEELYRKRI